MNCKKVYAGIMTADIETATKWYTALFGRKSDYHPTDNLHEWNFNNGGKLQLVQDEERAGSSSITLMVDDIDIVKKEFDEKNIKIEKQSESKVANTVTIFDPENNRIIRLRKIFKEGRRKLFIIRMDFNFIVTFAYPQL